MFICPRCETAPVYLNVADVKGFEAAKGRTTPGIDVTQDALLQLLSAGRIVAHLCNGSVLYALPGDTR